MNPIMNTPDDQDILIIIMDGLRPDYVRSEWMPRLVELGEQGMVARHHHAVYPSSTRVQASAIGTGTYPRKHGVMFNEMSVRQEPGARYVTSKAEKLRAFSEKLGEPVITTRTIGQYLEDAGIPMLMIGTGSQGASWLTNYTVAGTGVVNKNLTEPLSLRQQVEETLGYPTDDSPEHTRWAVDVYLEVALAQPNRPRVTVLWFTEPDKQQHLHGVGSPEVLDVVRMLDRELGRLLDTLETRGLRQRTNLFVLADHGFSDGPKVRPFASVLKEQDLLEGVDVTRDAFIYVQNRDKDRIEQVVRALQKEPSVGPIFTAAVAPGDTQGQISGTLSLEAVGCDHPTRAADILATPNWSDAPNDLGFPGGPFRGHSTLSPYEMQVRLTVSGPAFKSGGLCSEIPTGHIDLGPTILHLLDLPPAPTVDGRVLHELLADGPAPETIEAVHQPLTTSVEGYHLTVDRWHVDGAFYLSGCQVQRD